MRYVLILLSMLFGSATSAIAQVSVGVELPGMSIGFNQPYYPELVRVPGYPVYYAPGLNSNFFFYDGMYWIYERDNWYASSWYNGPWGVVDPEMVPLFVLRVPVRYYRDPPMYFRGWRNDAPPRWGDHWGHGWEQQRSGWDRWDRKSAPAPAPLPTYQRKYTGDRYPQAEQQRELHNQNYRYQPRDAIVQQHREGQAVPRVPASVPSRQERQEPIREMNARPQDSPRSSSPQRAREEMQRPAPTAVAPQQREPVVHDQIRQPDQGAARHEQPMPGASHDNAQQNPGTAQEQRHGQARQENPRDSGEMRGEGRNEGHGQERNR